MEEIGQVLERINGSHPNHSFVQGLLGAERAFERRSTNNKLVA